MTYPVRQMAADELYAHDAWLSLIAWECSPSDPAAPALMETGVRMRKTYRPDWIDHAYYLEGVGD